MLNATSITLSPAFYSKTGITTASCSVNGTASSAIGPIPYVTKPLLSLNPKAFKVGVPFNVTCTVLVFPASVTHNVTFQRDGKAFGLWTRPKATGAWAWQNVSAISGASVTASKPPLPFSVMVNSTKKDAAGRYSCSVDGAVGLLGVKFNFNSNTVSNGGLSGLVPPFFTFIFALVAAMLKSMVR